MEINTDIFFGTTVGVQALPYITHASLTSLPSPPLPHLTTFTDHTSHTMHTKAHNRSTGTQPFSEDTSSG